MCFFFIVQMYPVKCTVKCNCNNFLLTRWEVYWGSRCKRIWGSVKKMAALMKVLILSWKVLHVALVALFNVTQPLKGRYGEAEGKESGVEFQPNVLNTKKLYTYFEKTFRVEWIILTDFIIIKCSCVCLNKLEHEKYESVSFSFSTFIVCVIDVTFMNLIFYLKKGGYFDAYFSRLLRLNIGTVYFKLFKDTCF